MNWAQGFKTAYHASIVDPVTWADSERFEILEGSINRTDTGLRQSADIKCIDYPYGSDKWVRLWMDVEQDGGSDHIPLFTGLTSAPERKIDGSYSEMNVECFSVLKPAQDMYLPRGWYAAKGFIGSEQIDELLSVCPAPVDISEGSPRLSQHIIAEDGETHLSMITKLLDAIGWRLWIEGNGTIHVCPKAGTASVTFSSLTHDTIQPQVSVKSDWFNCPNVFRAVSDDDSATAYDNDPDSRLSTISRGRQVWSEETSVKLSDNESLLTYAKRRLKELQSVVTEISYDRAFHPDVMPSDIVRLHYPAQDLSGAYYVTSQKINMDSSGSTSEEVTAV